MFEKKKKYEIICLWRRQRRASRMKRISVSWMSVVKRKTQ